MKGFVLRLSSTLEPLGLSNTSHGRYNAKGYNTVQFFPLTFRFKCACTLGMLYTLVHTCTNRLGYRHLFAGGGEECYPVLRE